MRRKRAEVRLLLLDEWGQPCQYEPQALQTGGLFLLVVVVRLGIQLSMMSEDLCVRAKATAYGCTLHQQHPHKLPLSGECAGICVGQVPGGNGSMHTPSYKV